MRRREFISFLGSTPVWPLAARAQQASVPVIGYLSALSRVEAVRHMEMFHRGLNETGFEEGRNVTIEYRFASGQYERLPAMAAELVGHLVTVIVAQSPPAALAAKAASSTIPIVFAAGLDPVAAGLVTSFNKPGGNATGVVLIPGPLVQKRLELVRELVRDAAQVALLINPGSPEGAAELHDAQAAAAANGMQVRALKAATVAQIDGAFAAVAEHRPDAFLIAGDPFYYDRRQEIVLRIVRLGTPAVYPFRDFPEVGGLMSYGVNVVKSYLQVGIYAGRILQGAKPTDLPVVQPAELELVINLQSAKATGISIPATLHARADEVIE